MMDTKPELTVWYGAMPESNGKSNFTAILMRKGADFFNTDQYTFSRSEYPDRVRYEADFMRYLIGERTERPEMWDEGYDFDKHSGYAELEVSGTPPDAWMRNNLKECVTDVSKKQMENTDFGHWKEIAASYTIPLYTRASKEAVAVPSDEEILQIWEEVDCKGNATHDEELVMFARALLKGFK